MEPSVRQLEWDEIRRPLLPVADARSVVRDQLERLGIRFEEDDDPGLPSPAQSAAIQLEDGVQFAFEHHYTYGERRVTIHAEPGTPRPVDRLRELQRALHIDDGDIAEVAQAW